MANVLVIVSVTRHSKGGAHGSAGTSLGGSPFSVHAGLLPATLTTVPGVCWMLWPLHEPSR